MANNYSTSTSVYRPLSYSELLQPVLLADQEHKALEEQFGELSNKASVWEGMASQENDPFAYSLYQGYSNELRGQADNLATQGLTPNTRRSLIGLRDRYVREIVPIETAYNRRQELADEQRQIRLKDASARFNIDASQLSLDELIRNPSLSYTNYSGDAITKNVAQAASALSKELRDNPSKWKSILGGWYYETLRETGFKSEEVLQAIMNSPEASPILNNILDNAVASSGVAEWNNPNATRDAYEFAKLGLWNAVGSGTPQTLVNQGAVLAAQRKAAKTEEEDRGRRLNYQVVRKIGVDSDVNTSELQKDREWIERIIRNPEEALNATDTRQVNNSPYSYNAGGVGFPQESSRRLEEETYYPGREVLERVKEKYGTQDLNALYNQLGADIQNSAYKSYQYQFNLADNTLMAQDLQRSIRAAASFTDTVPLRKVKNGKIKGEADIKDINLINKDGNLVLDPYLGLLYNAIDEKGKTQQFAIDFTVLDNANGDLQSIWKNIQILRDNGMLSQIGHDVSQFIDELDDRFNSIAKVQGKTSDKVGPVDVTTQRQKEQSFLEAYGGYR